MAKVLLVNGSGNENGCTFTALSEVAAALEKEGIETEIFQLGKGVAGIPVDGQIFGNIVRRAGYGKCAGKGQQSQYQQHSDHFHQVLHGSSSLSRLLYYANTIT